MAHQIKNETFEAAEDYRFAVDALRRHFEAPSPDPATDPAGAAKYMDRANQLSAVATSCAQYLRDATRLRSV